MTAMTETKLKFKNGDFVNAFAAEQLLETWVRWLSGAAGWRLAPLSLRIALRARNHHLRLGRASPSR